MARRSAKEAILARTRVLIFTIIVPRPPRSGATRVCLTIRLRRDIRETTLADPCANQLVQLAGHATRLSFSMRRRTAFSSLSQFLSVRSEIPRSFASLRCGLSPSCPRQDRFPAELLGTRRLSSGHLNLTSPVYNRKRSNVVENVATPRPTTLLSSRWRSGRRRPWARRSRSMPWRSPAGRGHPVGLRRSTPAIGSGRPRRSLVDRTGPQVAPNVPSPAGKAQAW